ncbi:zinc finger translocation-associated protein isoform X3 [Brachyhypopomus gauderio]|uniref:zinc finger translocation-associated protein isoform X3 n=1 Tax=Brachyhypopomus gauderio TaxID=698409 RepID=UPI00404328CD
MEEKESKESEPEVPSAEQTECLSLIISAEEGEATPRRGAPGDPSAGDGDMTNGHIGDGSLSSVIASVCSPGTSYWSVSESPNSPFLLSPVPGPSGHKPAPAKPARASRPGLSRIPGRDHRRYYHEYWRSEYLMDFDPRRHGMICMVCGSSLATLKLSTIKRHIRQKHPDSLLWSASDKEVIRSGWESHLNLESSQTPFCPEPAVATKPEETQSCAKQSAAPPAGEPSGGEMPKPQLHSRAGRTSSSPPSPEPRGPSAQMLERYLNDSLHAWFRQEFLMEYQAEASRLVCMVCGRPLPSLHLDHIKGHVLELHPDSLVYSAEEKHHVLQTWALKHESDSSRDFFKSEPDTKDLTVNSSVQFFPPETQALQDCAEAYVAGEGRKAKAASRPLPGQRLRNGCPWRLRLDYLVALGPPGRPGCYCMVCSEQLPLARVSGFRRHIQERHPETSSLSRREREDIASAWSEEGGGGEPATHTQQALPSDYPPAPPPNDTQATSARPGAEADDVPGLKAPPTPGRHGHYPGKDQRRNYQVRWRMEFLMDYDCRRHGLICMVCGATLATLKVSTIKRHIQQVHPRSLDYSAEEKQRALHSYNQTALHFIHSDDCFSTAEHGAGALIGPAGCYST